MCIFNRFNAFRFENALLPAKFAAVFIFMTLPLFLSCNKSYGKNAVASEPPVQIDPRIVKFGFVYDSMGERFKDEVFIPEDKILDCVDRIEKVIADDRDDLLRFNDKKHLLPSDYAPTDLISLKNCEAFVVSRNDLSLRKTVYENLLTLGTAAKNDGITLVVSSTYRSYAYQERLYERNVRELGQEMADRESAKPGSSQHQLGVVVDFGSVTDDFAKTAQCQWLNENAMDYGWSLSFPQGYEDVTGFRWECWQFRYIGEEACRLQKEYFNDVQHFLLEFIDAWKNN